MRSPAIVSPVRILTDGVELAGDLTVPEDAATLVVFVYGSGSSRLDPQGRASAEQLNERGHATLLIDLLTAAEDDEERKTRHLQYDMTRLAGRLAEVTRWAVRQEGLRQLPLAYLGTGSGAAAALIAATLLPDLVQGVISHSGRPDLAGAAMDEVTCPVLLLVGGQDHELVGENQAARSRIKRAPIDLHMVPRAGPLFDEPGTRQEAAGRAAEWLSNRVAEGPKD